MRFYVINNGHAACWRNTWPFIRDYCRRHGYEAVVADPADRASHFSWQKLLAHSVVDDDLIVAWDAHLVPLPHAPPLHEYLDSSRLNGCRWPATRRTVRRYAAVGEHVPAGGFVAASWLGIPRSLASELESIHETAQDRGIDIGEELTRQLALRAIPFQQLDAGWNVPAGRFCDLAALQSMFVLNVGGRRYREDYLSTVVHDHYYGPTYLSRHGGQVIELIEQLGTTALQGAEIGVFRGETSAQLLRRFPGMRLLLVDAWTAYSPDHPYRVSADASSKRSLAEQLAHYRAAEANTRFAAERRDFRGLESSAAAAAVADASLDFVFIDGDHTYEGVSSDLRAWWPKLRKGGLCCGHDFDHPRDRRGVWGVRQAVTEFAQTNNVPMHVGRETVWWLWKAA